MAVYVDDMKATYRRMVMSHMIATDEAELHAMASLIGVARKWYQGDHYDVCQEMRTRAVAAGAIEITQRQLGYITLAHRKSGVWMKPEEAKQYVHDFFAADRAPSDSREG